MTFNMIFVVYHMNFATLSASSNSKFGGNSGNIGWLSLFIMFNGSLKIRPPKLCLMRWVGDGR
jgi:hypothetical protein